MKIPTSHSQRSGFHICDILELNNDKTNNKESNSNNKRDNSSTENSSSKANVTTTPTKSLSDTSDETSSVNVDDDPSNNNNDNSINNVKCTSDGGTAIDGDENDGAKSEKSFEHGRRHTNIEQQHQNNNTDTEDEGQVTVNSRPSPQPSYLGRYHAAAAAHQAALFADSLHSHYPHSMFSARPPWIYDTNDSNRNGKSQLETENY